MGLLPGEGRRESDGGMEKKPGPGASLRGVSYLNLGGLSAEVRVSENRHRLAKRRTEHRQHFGPGRPRRLLCGRWKEVGSRTHPGETACDLKDALCVSLRDGNCARNAGKQG